MKRTVFFILALFTLGSIAAQPLNPVKWDFASKKVGEGVYEIQMVATIQPGWHLYSQSQPKDAIAQPTSFMFNKNPLLDFDGHVKEIGKLEKFKDEVLDVSANQYSEKVTFVQKVKIRAKAKTAVIGKLEFQTCNDQKCLPPKTVNFSITLI